MSTSNGLLICFKDCHVAIAVAGKRWCSWHFSAGVFCFLQFFHADTCYACLCVCVVGVGGKNTFIYRLNADFISTLQSHEFLYRCLIGKDLIHGGINFFWSMDFWVVFNLKVVVGERERHLECSIKSVYKQLYKMTVGISFPLFF